MVMELLGIGRGVIAAGGAEVHIDPGSGSVGCSGLVIEEHETEVRDDKHCDDCDDRDDDAVIRFGSHKRGREDPTALLRELRRARNKRKGLRVFQGFHECQEQNGTDERGDERPERTVSVNIEHAEDEATEDGTDDADHEVADHPKTAAFDDEACKPARDDTDENGVENVHR